MLTVKELREICLHSSCTACEYYWHCCNLGGFITEDDYSDVLPYLLTDRFIELLDDNIYFDDDGYLKKYYKRD